METKTTRFGHGAKLYVIDVEPNLKLDIASVTKGETAVAMADTTRLDDPYRRMERAGPVGAPTYEVALYHSGPLPVAVGSRHRFRIIGAAGRGETSGPQEEFEAEVMSAGGPTYALDGNPQMVTLTLQASGEVAFTPASTEIVQS
jgi:hypothetical protein